MFFIHEKLYIPSFLTGDAVYIGIKIIKGCSIL